MPTSTEHYNAARASLEKAKAALEEQNTTAYDAHWVDYTKSLDLGHKAKATEEAEKALTPDGSDNIQDYRSEHEAGLIKTVDRSLAKDGVELANGRVVPFATKDSEGYIKGYPAAVQHPLIMQRYGPELRKEAQVYSDAFMRYFRKGYRSLDADHIKALQEGTDSEGGFLVPSDQVKLPYVHDPGVQGGTIRPISSNFTTTRDGGDWPTVGSVLWASVAEEAALPTTTDPVFGQVTFAIKKIMGHHKVAAELLEDSAVDIGGIINFLYAESLGRYEDQQAIEGDGTTEPEGIRTSGGTDSTGAGLIDASDGWDAGNVLQIYFQLQSSFRGNATWHTTGTTAARMFAIGAAAAGIHFVPESSFNGAPTLGFMGRPLVMFDGTGWDTTLSGTNEYGCLGDFRQYYFINRVGMSIRRLDELYAGNDQVGFVARVRYDGVVALDTAFLIMKGEA